MKERPILFSDPMVRALLSGQKTQTRRVVKPLQEPKLQDDGTWFSVVQKHPRWGFGVSGDTEQECAAKLVEFGGCPYGQPGDRLAVREGFYAFGRWETRFSQKKGRDEWHFIDMTLECGHSYSYTADGNHPVPMGGRRNAGVTPGWWRRPSIFMPRAACRLVLEIVSVRVERLQDISEDDARAEGLKGLSKDGTLVKYGIPDRDGLPGNDDDGWQWAAWEADPRCAFRRLWEHINGAESWAANPWVWVIEFRRVQP